MGAYVTLAGELTGVDTLDESRLYSRLSVDLRLTFGAFVALASELTGS